MGEEDEKPAEKRGMIAELGAQFVQQVAAVLPQIVDEYQKNEDKKKSEHVILNMVKQLDIDLKNALITNDDKQERKVWQISYGLQLVAGCKTVTYTPPLEPEAQIGKTEE